MILYNIYLISKTKNPYNIKFYSMNPNQTVNIRKGDNDCFEQKFDQISFKQLKGSLFMTNFSLFQRSQEFIDQKQIQKQKNRLSGLNNEDICIEDSDKYDQVDVDFTGIKSHQISFQNFQHFRNEDSTNTSLSSQNQSNCNNKTNQKSGEKIEGCQYRGKQKNKNKTKNKNVLNSIFYEPGSKQSYEINYNGQIQELDQKPPKKLNETFKHNKRQSLNSSVSFGRSRNSQKKDKRQQEYRLALKYLNLVQDLLNEYEQRQRENQRMKGELKKKREENQKFMNRIEKINQKIREEELKNNMEFKLKAEKERRQGKLKANYEQYINTIKNIPNEDISVQISLNQYKKYTNQLTPNIESYKQLSNLNQICGIEYQRNYKKKSNLNDRIDKKYQSFLERKNIQHISFVV